MGIPFLNGPVPTFNIYCIGDALYLQRVINGVAMMSQSNMLVALGVIGLLLGIIFMIMRAITSGMQRVELPGMIFSVIAFVVMFGLRANVVINDMVGPPFGPEGIATPPTVSNVPYGVAVAGWLISDIGYTLAETIEQANGRPGSTFGGVTSGGFGKSLAWLNAIRNLDIPEINNSDGTVLRFKQNTKTYLTKCALIEAGYKRLNLTAALGANSILADGTTATETAGAGGIGIHNQFLTMEWTDSTGVSVIQCLDALGRLRAMASGPLYQSVAEALSSKSMKWLSDPRAQLDDAFSQIAMDTSKAQAYVTNMAVLSVWNDAMKDGQNGPNPLATVMLEQAKQQRASQWAGEESMFKSVARGFSAFFEGMLYACAPFMALAIGLGSIGWTMVIRYMMLSAWVALWLPVLAIINLFQVTVIEHAVNAMQNTFGSNATSAASAVHLAGQINEWVGVGASLAASTPAITLTLLLGGAVTATALMGRMQGGDHINEKLTSPDVTNATPAMQQSSSYTYDPSSGLRQAGSDNTIPVIRGDAVASVSESSARAHADQVTESYLKGMGRDIQSFVSNRGSFSVGASHTEGASMQQSRSDFASAAKAAGLNINNENSLAFARAAAMIMNGGANAGLGLSGGGGGAAGNLGFSGGASGSSSDEQRQVTLQKLSEALNSNTGEGHELRYAAAKLLNDSVTTSSGSEAAHGNTTTGSNSFGHNFSNVKSSEESYRKAAQRTQQYSAGQQANVAQLARSLIAGGHGDSVIQSAIQHGPGGAAGLATATNSLHDPGARSGLSQTGRSEMDYQRKVEAGLMQLNKGFEHGDAQAREALLGALSDSGMFMGSDMASSASSMDAGQFGSQDGPGKSGAEIQATVGGQSLGSGTSASAVAGEAAGLQSSSGALATEHVGAVGANPLSSTDADHLRSVQQDPSAAEGTLSSFQQPFEKENAARTEKARDTDAALQDEEGAGSWGAGFGRLLDGMALKQDGEVLGAMLNATEGKPAMRMEFGAMGAISGPREDFSFVDRANTLRDNPDQRAAAQEYFHHMQASGSGIASYGYSGVASENVATAMSAVATAREFGGFTPELRTAFNSSVHSMTQQQQKAFFDLSNNSRHPEYSGSRTALSGNYSR